MEFVPENIETADTNENNFWAPVSYMLMHKISYISRQIERSDYILLEISAQPF